MRSQNRKDKKTGKGGWMEGIFASMLLLSALFIVLNLGMILVGGVPFLGEALRSEEVRFSIGLSVSTATISTVICMLLAIPSGYILARREFFGKKIVSTVLEIPLSLPYIVLGVCLLLLFSSRFGKALREAGLPVVFDQNGIIAAQLLVNLPFAVSMVRTAVSGLDPHMEFIGEMLGASYWYVFRTITLSMCRTSLLSAALVCWSRALGEFGATLMLVGVTRMKTETLPGNIYLNISTGNNGPAMATAILLLIAAMAVQLVIRCLAMKEKKTGR